MKHEHKYISELNNILVTNLKLQIIVLSDCETYYVTHEWKICYAKQRVCLLNLQIKLVLLCSEIMIFIHCIRPNLYQSSIHEGLSRFREGQIPFASSVKYCEIRKVFLNCDWNRSHTWTMFVECRSSTRCIDLFVKLPHCKT